MPKLKSPGAKGARLERKIKKLLEEEGFLVFRSAGSHGIFDLAAIGHNKVRLLQCKAGNAKPSKLEMDLMKAYQGPPFTSKELWIWKDRAKAPEITIIEKPWNPGSGCGVCGALATEYHAQYCYLS